MAVHDGRLEIDDLGGVIEDATSIEAAPASEVLDHGRGRTWGERLGDAGATPWIRRHRLALVSATATVLLLGGATTWFLVTRPPALDPTIRVTASEVAPEFGRAPNEWVAFDPGAVQRTAFGLTPQQDGDPSTYAVVGIAGDGIRASQAYPHAAVPDVAPFANDVSFLLDCDDVSAVDPAPDSYHLIVRRTDADGRTVTGRVDPPPRGTGTWQDFVALSCLRYNAETALTVGSVRAVPVLADNSVALDVAVRSALRIPATVDTSGSNPGVGFDAGPGITYVAAPTPLAPGGDAVVPVTLRVTDCTSPSLSPIFPSQQADGSQTGVPGLFLGLTPGGVGNGEQFSTSLRWTAGQQRTIDAAIAAVCAGAPRIAVSVGEVRSGPPVAVGDDGGLRRSLWTTWRIATSGTSVELGPRLLRSGEQTGTTFTPATTSAPVVSGAATVRTLWNFDYTQGFIDPPTLRILVTTPDGTYPYEVRVTSSRLAEAIAADIPGGLEIERLVGSGWDPPPGYDGPLPVNG